MLCGEICVRCPCDRNYRLFCFGTYEKNNRFLTIKLKNLLQFIKIYGIITSRRLQKPCKTSLLTPERTLYHQFELSLCGFAAHCAWGTMKLWYNKFIAVDVTVRLLIRLSACCIRRGSSLVKSLVGYAGADMRTSSCKSVFIGVCKVSLYIC